MSEANTDSTNCSCPWAEKFNALPDEVRTIGAALEAKTRIQHLNFEKRRLKANYQKSCREINQHIKECERWLKELEGKNQKVN